MTSDILKRVVEIVHQLGFVDGESGDEGEKYVSSTPLTTTLSELRQIHDALVDSLQSQVQQDTSIISHRGSMVDIVRFQLLSFYDETHEMGLDITEQVATEADLHLAILGISMHLLQSISAGTNDNEIVDDSTKKRLQHTIQQSTLLLKILSSIYLFSCGGGTDDLSVARPSRYPILQRWIHGMEQQSNPSWGEGETSNIISFDKQDLSQEEDQLLLMANTPTPLEAGQGANQLQYTSSNLEDCIFHSNMLVARMSSKYLKREEVRDQPPSVQIFMDHRGLIRLRGQGGTGMDSWWAALSPASTTDYKSPTFTITSVAIPTGNFSDSNNQFALSTIELEVGRDGRQWWEATAAVIQQLNDLQSLRDEIEKLWPREQVEIQISSASKELWISRHE